jgi:hypothetical protein
MMIPATSLSQESTTTTQQGTSDVEGTVVSASRDTMVVKTGDHYQLFRFDPDTARPPRLGPGARVRVSSTPTDDPGVRLATNVTELEPAPGSQAAQTKEAPPPASVTKAQREVESEARRWHVGGYAGAALDPELFLFGAHMRLGPIFSRKVTFRPSAEFDFGEITDMIALNLEVLYQVPLAAHGGKWSGYFGAGPSLNFTHQGLHKRDISFGNFDYETGFNILAGFQSRRGEFVELKTSLWDRPVPVLRMVVGYTF